jgi:hypothetical protein
VEGLVREDLQRDRGVEPRHVRRADEPQDRRADVRTNARVVRRRVTVELHDAARLFDRPGRELLAAHLDGTSGDEAGDLAQAALQRRRVVVRDLQVVPILLVVVAERLGAAPRRQQVRGEQDDRDREPSGDLLERRRPHRLPIGRRGREPDARMTPCT